MRTERQREASDAVDEIVRAWQLRDPQLDASPLEVVGRLLLAARQLEDALVEVLVRFDLSFADFDVINTLRRRADADGTHPGELARSSLVTSGAMTARLDRLARAGLVVREADPHDRRAVRVRLSARGEQLAAEALEAVLEADEAFLAPLDGRERELVAALLKRLLLADPARGGV